jgi:hypothetical protein
VPGGYGSPNSIDGVLFPCFAWQALCSTGSCSTVKWFQCLASICLLLCSALLVFAHLACWWRGYPAFHVVPGVMSSSSQHAFCLHVHSTNNTRSQANPTLLPLVTRVQSIKVQALRHLYKYVCECHSSRSIHHSDCSPTDGYFFDWLCGKLMSVFSNHSMLVCSVQ